MERTDDARTRILDAAEHLFAEHGFDATATAKIAAHAAVPKGLLFYYFPTKADILRRLVGERLDFGPIDTRALVEPGNPVRSLLNLTKELYDIQRASNVLRVIIWREQRTHPEVGANLVEHRRQVQTVVERVLQASFVKPINAIRLSAAAQAWVAIVTMRPLADRSDDPGNDDPATELHTLAQIICDGAASES
jgi:AcrR family transcriptional regulator